MEEHLKTLSDFMLAAQTLTAIYGSPDGPTDPVQYYEHMASLLDDSKLLAAQFALAPGKYFLMMAEQILPACAVA